MSDLTKGAAVAARKHRVRYIGPHTDGVEIPSLGLIVAHGETVEVDEETYTALCEQPDNWQPVKAAKDAATD
jgi:hypothetical protein